MNTIDNGARINSQMPIRKLVSPITLFIVVVFVNSGLYVGAGFDDRFCSGT